MHIRNAKQRIDRDGAETIAVDALSFLAARPDDFTRFLALTGLQSDTIRQSARDPGFLGGVLDYLLGDERLLVAFAEEAGLAPESIAGVRRRLDGADGE